jgi:hypothetical protein
VDSSVCNITRGVGISVIIYVGVGGMGWNGVTVVVASGGAQTINIPGPWLDSEPPPNKTQAISKNPNTSSAMAKIGLRHLDGSLGCFPDW